MPFMPCMSIGWASAVPGAVFSTLISMLMAPAFASVIVSGAIAPSSKGLLEAEQHDVIAAGLELERGAGLYFDPVLHGPHLHHAVLDAGFVDLCLFRDGALSRNERIGVLAGVLDCEINGAVLALGRRARPCVENRQILAVILLSLRGVRGEERERCCRYNREPCHADCLFSGGDA